MRISKSDLGMLEGINYNSEDYHIYDNNDNLIEYEEHENDFDRLYVIQQLNKIVDTYFIITGSSGTWQGNKAIKDGCIDDIQKVLNRMNVDSISICFNKEEQAIEINGSHHDGIDTFYLRKPEWYSRKELIDLCIDLSESVEELKENLREEYNCYLGHVFKYDLIDYLEDFLLEDYN